MISLYILIGAISLFNAAALVCMAYFMYKSTLNIAAFKKANEPWEILAINGQKKEIAMVNESELTDDSSFGTIPVDPETLVSLRNNL